MKPRDLFEAEFGQRFSLAAAKVSHDRLLGLLLECWHASGAWSGYGARVLPFNRGQEEAGGYRVMWSRYVTSWTQCQSDWHNDRVVKRSMCGDVRERDCSAWRVCKPKHSLRSHTQENC